MERYRQWNKAYVFQGDGGGLVTDGKHSVAVRGMLETLLAELVDSFWRLETPERFLAERSGERGELEPLLRSLIRSGLLPEASAFPPIFPAGTAAALCTERAFLEPLRQGMVELGFRVAGHVLAEEQPVPEALVGRGWPAECLHVLFLPGQPGALIDILMRHGNLGIWRLALGHVHLDEAWSTVLEPPRTACPRCLARRLTQNLPTFQHVASRGLRPLAGAQRGSERLALELLLQGLVSFTEPLGMVENPGIGGHLAVMHTGRLTLTRERVLRQPDCDCQWESRLEPHDLIGPHTGIIRKIGQVPLRPSDPNVVYLAGYVGGEKQAKGGAADWDWEHGRLRARGECLERYAWTNARPRELTLARWSELDPAMRLPLADFHPYSDQQYRTEGFPYQRLDPEEPVHWLPMRRLNGYGTVYVPAVLVLRTPDLAGPRMGPRSSTGLAVGQTAEAALQRATTELVERDAVTRNWLQGGPFRCIEPEPGLVRQLPAYQRCLDAALTPELYLVPNPFGLPVVICRLSPVRAEDLIIAYGSAAAADPVSACDKAVLEAILMRVYLRQLLENSDGDRRGHGGMAFLRDAQPEAPAFLQEAPAIRQAELASEPRNALQDGFICYADISPDDLRSGGIRVVKAWSPAMTGFVPRREAAPLRLFDRPLEALVPGYLPFS